MQFGVVKPYLLCLNCSTCSECPVECASCRQFEVLYAVPSFRGGSVALFHDRFGAFMSLSIMPVEDMIVKVLLQLWEGQGLVALKLLFSACLKG